MKPTTRRRVIVALMLAIGAVAGCGAWRMVPDPGLPDGIASGNGRVEATEIDIAAKIPGRVQDISVNEGDFVTAGQVIAVMNTDQLQAQRRQAQAQLERARIGVDTAQALLTQRIAEQLSAQAVIAERTAELDNADRRLARSQELVKTNATPVQTLDNDRAAQQRATASLQSARAQEAATEAAINAARASVVDAKAAVDAAQAAVDAVTADIDDSTLRSPRDGRVQYRIAQPGEVLAAGGRVLNMVDLSDVYMTFFLPTAQAGRVPMGAEVRLVLDAVPNYVIPAKATFVSDVAQFTPKTVETRDEREKLMFRIKAQVPADLLRRHIQQVKTGLPGVAYVRLDPSVAWPESLDRNVLQ